MFSFFTADNSKQNPDEKNGVSIPKPKKPICDGFRLPISYCKEKHTLSPIVSQDLELIEGRKQETLDKTITPNEPPPKSMYDHILQPTHSFGKQMAEEWNATYTTDVDFLKDTQQIIQGMDCFINNPQSLDDDVPLKIEEIWKEVKEKEDFLEKYSFLEWEMLKHLNNSSSFLQIFSMIQLLSPLLSLLLPFMILLVPFFILQIKGISITFFNYIGILKEIAGNHFFGKMLSIKTFDSKTILYMIFSFIFYLLSIYNNTVSCIRFYLNIKRINEDLIVLREYIRGSVLRISHFREKHGEKETYRNFLQETEKHQSRLADWVPSLTEITPFSFHIKKTMDFGKMLKLYYELHANKELEESLRYAFGFDGYLNNLMGLYTHYKEGHIQMTTFGMEPEDYAKDKDKDTDKDTDSTDSGSDEKEETPEETKSTGLVIKGQFYPPLLHKNPVKNDISLKKNIILSGPNASGKTTVLKTTTMNVIFSQQFGCGFFDECYITPYHYIHTYLNIPDTSQRDSLFQAESRRCKEIIDIIRGSGEKRHFCIFDELYSGTNYNDSVKSSVSFLRYLLKQQEVNFILTTHNVSVCKKMSESKEKQEIMIENYRMKVLTGIDVENLRETDVDEQESIVFTYKMEKGISEIEGGVYILKDLDYPQEIMDGFDPKMEINA